MRSRSSCIEFFDAHAHPSLSIGRVWVSKTVSVIEFGFSGVRSAGDVAGKRIPERPFGLVGACAVTFDAAGLIRSHRVYVDLATYIGQTDPERLLAGTKVRAAIQPRGQRGARVERHTDRGAQPGSRQ